MESEQSQDFSQLSLSLAKVSDIQNLVCSDNASIPPKTRSDPEAPTSIHEKITATRLQCGLQKLTSMTDKWEIF